MQQQNERPKAAATKPPREWTAKELVLLPELAAEGMLDWRIAEVMQRPKASIRCKLTDLKITINQEKQGKERRCSNWDSSERPCREIYRSKWAGPCPKCRGGSMTAFDVPARLLA